MGWIVAAILAVSGICFFFIFFSGGSSGPGAAVGPGGHGEFPVSKTRIDLSAFDGICKKDGEVDFWPLPGNDCQTIKELFSDGQPVTPELLKRNQPVKIVYVDNKKGEKTVRDIIPYRIIGSVDDDDGQKDYDFYLEAFCLMRNAERSFHSNGIEAAWYNGKEINLGNYLADLYKRTKKKQAEAALQ